jgi:HAD superfamily hydrolase (TIGR01509 family)
MDDARQWRFDAVIFDMDGLLLNTERLGIVAWGKAARDCGYVVDDSVWHSLIGHDLTAVEKALRGCCGPDLSFHDVLVACDTRYREAVFSAPTLLKPGARELLDRLYVLNIPCALATSSGRMVVQYCVEAAQVSDRFAAIVVREDVAVRKPAPDVFLLAAARLGVAPQRCVVLEDSAAGVEAAVAAGMRVLLVPDLQSPSDYVRRLTAAVLPSLHEVAVHLGVTGS